MINHRSPVNFDIDNFLRWFEIATAQVTRYLIADFDAAIAQIQSLIDDAKENDLGEAVTERIIRDVKARGFSAIESIADDSSTNIVFK